MPVVRPVRHPGRDGHAVRTEAVTDSALLDLILRELDDAGWWQKDLAQAIGCTEKHLSQLLNGHVAMSEAWAVRVLAALGRQLVVASAPLRCPPAEDAT